MSKEDIQDKALVYALGALPEDDQEGFERALRSDPELREQTHDWQRLIELEALAAPQEEAPFHVYARVMERIDEERAAPALDPIEATPTASGRFRFASLAAWGGWGVAACALLALGLGSLQEERDGPAPSAIVVNEMANPRVVPVGAPSEDHTLEERMMELAGLAEAYWFAREGVPAGQSLADAAAVGAEVDPLSGGFTVFDRNFGIGFIAVENLPAESDGKSYHVWAKTANGARPVRAGSLPIGDESRGLFFFDVSNLPELKSLDQVSFFVTEETGEAPTAPEGLVVLSDSANGPRRGSRF